MKPAIRSSIKKPQTLKDYMAQKREAAERKQKRIAKMSAIGSKTSKVDQGALRKRLMAVCLELGSQFIRRRDSKKTGGRCVFGCGRPIECWFHFIKQSRSLKTRFDERNIVASCFACNGKMEHGEGWAWAWYANTYGLAQMNEILRLSHGTANFSIADLEEIRDNFKRRIQTGDY